MGCWGEAKASTQNQDIGVRGWMGEVVVGEEGFIGINREIMGARWWAGDGEAKASTQNQDGEAGRGIYRELSGLIGR